MRWPPCWMSFQIFSGVSGISMWRTPKRRKRIHHGVHDGGGTTDGAGLAHALHAQRIHGRRRLGVAAFDPGHGCGSGNGVVGQLAGHELAVVVVDGLFPEGLAESLGDAAVDLPVDDQGVDDACRNRPRRRSGGCAMLPVSRSTSVTTMWAPKGKVKLGGSQKWVDDEAGLGVGREFLGVIRRRGHFARRRRICRCAASMQAPPVEGDVVGFQQHGAEFLHLGLEVLEGVIERRAADGRAAAAEGADAVLHDGGVAVDDQDVVDGDAELVGDNLREGGFLALAVGRSAGHHGDFAGGLDLDGGAFPASGGERDARVPWRRSRRRWRCRCPSGLPSARAAAWSARSCGVIDFGERFA